MKHVLRHIISLGLILAAVPAAAQLVREDAPELRGIDVVEHLGDTIPLDLTFTDDHGQTVTLGHYFGQGKPVVLMLGYYECPMLCNLVFNGLTKAIPNVDLAMGEEYQVVTVSIDPRETHHLAAAKKENYLKEIGATESPDGWAFLVGDSAQIATLAGALGFQFYFVDERGEFAHPAVLFLLSDQGMISRYLYGIEYSPRDLKLGLVEASRGGIGSTLDRIILYCYHYDPNAGSYVLFAQNVMFIGGLLSVFVLGTFLTLLWMRDRSRRRRDRSTRDTHHVSVG